MLADVKMIEINKETGIMPSTQADRKACLRIKALKLDKDDDPRILANVDAEEVPVDDDGL